MHHKLSRSRAYGVSADPFATITAPALEYRPVAYFHRQPPSPYDRSLDRSAVAWLHALPSVVRPRETPLRFPRIINRLARYWDAPRMADEVFAALLDDRRVGRKGYPPPVHEEICALYAYFRAQHPVGSSNRWSLPIDYYRKARVRY